MSRGRGEAGPLLRLAQLGGLIGLALAVAPASAQIAGGAKRAGPIPYVEAFGRRAAKAHPKAAPARPAARPGPKGSAAAAPRTAAAPAPGLVLPSPAAGTAPPPRPSIAGGRPPAGAARPAAAARPASPPRLADAAGPGIDAAALPAFVDGLVAQAQSSDHLVGVAVAVVQNGRVLFEKGYGATAPGATGRPVDPRATLFRLGSVSKVLTWIEVLKLVETGRLKLDASVDSGLPPALRPPSEGFRTPITLAELMTHSSGFEAREFGRLYSFDPDRLRPLDQALVRDRPRRVRSPGEMSSYSSYDAALAGAMVQTAAGRPFDEALEHDLLAPAGLTATSFRQPYPPTDGLPAPLAPALAARLATGAVWTPAGFRALPFEFSGFTPALSALSTADDMARLMLTMLARGRAPATGAAVWGEAAARALETGPAPGWTYGLMRFPLPGGREGFGHEGATLGFRDELMVVPSLGLGVFVAADSDTGARLVRRLPEAVVARFGPPAVPPPPAAAPAADPQALRDRVAGLYLSTRRAYHGLEGFVDRLTRLYRVRVGEGAQVVASGPGGARAFRESADPDVFVSVEGGARLRFRPASGGAASAFSDPSGVGAAERVGWLQHPSTLAATAAVATLAALLTLAGPFVRGREVRQTPAQARGSALQVACALLWLGAVGAFAVFENRAADPVRLYTAWPDPWLVAASCAALAVALGTVAQGIGLPSVLSDARRVQGWNGWRKLRHGLTLLCFLAASFVLAAWGALEPWSS